MRHMFDGFNDIIRLDKGERLSDALQQFVADTKLPGAWVSGVGGALEMTLGFYDLDAKSYQWKDYTGLYEVTNLSGNLAMNEAGEMMFHLHGTFADRNYKVVGGHVKDLVAAGTLELFVHRMYKPLRRTTNPEVGLQTLDVRDDA